MDTKELGEEKRRSEEELDKVSGIFCIIGKYGTLAACTLAGKVLKLFGYGGGHWPFLRVNKNENDYNK